MSSKRYLNEIAFIRNTVTLQLLSHVRSDKLSMKILVNEEPFNIYLD